MAGGTYVSTAAPENGSLAPLQSNGTEGSLAAEPCSSTRWMVPSDCCSWLPPSATSTGSSPSMSMRSTAAAALGALLPACCWLAAALRMLSKARFCEASAASKAMAGLLSGCRTGFLPATFAAVGGWVGARVGGAA